MGNLFSSNKYNLETNESLVHMINNIYTKVSDYMTKLEKYKNDNKISSDIFNKSLDWNNIITYKKKIDAFKNFVISQNQSQQSLSLNLDKILLEKDAKLSLKPEARTILDKYNSLISALVKKRIIYKYCILYLTIKILFLNFTIRDNLLRLDATINTFLNLHKHENNQQAIYDSIVKILGDLNNDYRTVDENYFREKETEIESLRNRYNEDLKKLKSITPITVNNLPQEPSTMSGGASSVNIYKLSENIKIEPIRLFMDGYIKDFGTFKDYDRKAQKYIVDVTSTIDAYYRIYIVILQKINNINQGVDLQILSDKFKEINEKIKQNYFRSDTDDDKHPAKLFKDNFKGLLLDTIDKIKKDSKEFTDGGWNEFINKVNRSEVPT